MELKLVKENIKRNNLRWQAEMNPIAELSTEEFRKLCGTLPETPEKYIVVENR